MEVILLKDVPKVGRRNEVVTVSEGYAINFLIPRGLAKAATAGAKRELETRKDKLEHEADEDRKKVSAGIKEINSKTVTLHGKANEQGHLFAALHADKVAEAVYAQLGVCLPESVFVLDPIKNLGTYDVPLVGADTKGSVTLLVERES